MAKATGISLRSVQRIWQAYQLQPHRIRTFNTRASVLKCAAGAAAICAPARCAVPTPARCRLPWPSPGRSNGSPSAAVRCRSGTVRIL
jgi:hypothetical protein